MCKYIIDLFYDRLPLDSTVGRFLGVCGYGCVMRELGILKDCGALLCGAVCS